MFNNPFNSFHEIVAGAKQEREQLERLLTISTPRERLIVVIIALALLIFSTWLFFGNVSRSLTVDGVFVGPGEISSVDNRSIAQVLVWIKRDVARNIQTSMPVVLELSETDGDQVKIDGKIANILSEPIAEKLSGFESKLRVLVYRVEIELDETIDSASITDTKCRVVIQLGKQPPIALFRMKHS